MSKLAFALAFVFVFAGCSATRPEEGGLTESEVIVITALVRSGADIGCDQVKEASEASLVVSSLQTVSDALEGGDFTTGTNVLQERINLSLGQTRAVLNAIMALRAIIPTVAFESQYVEIFGAGVDECILLLETKFPEIAPSFGQKVLNAVGF